MKTLIQSDEFEVAGRKTRTDLVVYLKRQSFLRPFEDKIPLSSLLIILKSYYNRNNIIIY